jgi:hypothetical protein
MEAAQTNTERSVEDLIVRFNRYVSSSGQAEMLNIDSRKLSQIEYCTSDCGWATLRLSRRDGILSSGDTIAC